MERSVKRREKKLGVTVCIAAICSYEFVADGQPRPPMIVMISDRRYTVDDHWTYEPKQTKHYPFGQPAHAVALVSGTISTMVSICSKVQQDLGPPPYTRDISEIAERLALSYADYRRAEAERFLLTPLGVDTERLLSDTSIPESTIIRLSSELRKWNFQESAILAGMDQAGGAHIFAICNPGWARLENGSGFVAVGSGSDHASAEFMHNQYERTWGTARAIFLAYTAKRRAEVDPYVGRETDIYILGPGDNPYTQLEPEIIQRLESAYDEYAKDEQEREGKAYGRFEEHVKEVLNAKAAAQSQAANGGTDEPSRI